MYMFRFGKKIERMPYFLNSPPNINLRTIITITNGIITIHPNTDTIIVYNNHFNNIIPHLLIICVPLHYRVCICYVEKKRRIGFEPIPLAVMQALYQ